MKAVKIDFPPESVTHDVDYREEKGSGPARPVLLDLAELARTEPATLRSVIVEMMPLGYATLFAADGGTGKSQIALYIAVHVALGLPIWGLAVMQLPVVMFSFEDRQDVLHLRLARICRHLGIEMASLKGKLFLYDGVDADATMFTFDARKGPQVELPYQWAHEQVAKVGPALVVVDGVADVNAASEISRQEVKAFVRSMMQLSGPDGAVLLIAHVNRETAGNTGGSRQGYSGSTAWNNSVRSRWYLRELTAAEGAVPGRKELVLEVQKSNLGPTGRKVLFAWDDEARLFLPTSKEVPSVALTVAREGALHDWVVRSCAEGEATGNPVPAAGAGPRPFTNVLTARADCPPEFKRNGGYKALRTVVEELRQDGRLVIEARRRNGNSTEYLIAALGVTSHRPETSK